MCSKSLDLTLQPDLFIFFYCLHLKPSLPELTEVVEPQKGAILAPSSLLLPGATLLITESLGLEKTSKIVESGLLGKNSIMERVVKRSGCPGKRWDLEMFRK